MSATITRLATKRGRVPALVTAVGVLAVLLAQDVLSSLVGYFQASSSLSLQAAQAESNGLYDLNVGFSPWPTLEGILRFVLPFALGVFLSLWVIAPVSHELTPRFVLTRAGLATLAGAVLVIIANVLFAVFGAFSPTGSLSGNSFPTPGFDGSYLVQGMIAALAAGLNAVISKAPLVLLAGVLLWLWLRDHPREYAVSGLIDEI